ncbi:MAG: YfhO family protein, partial [Candidatus Binatia bacterium]
RPDPEPQRIFYYPGPFNMHPSYYSLLKRPSFAQFNSLAFSNLIPNTGVFYGFEYMQELDALIRWPYNAFLAVANKLPYERLGTLLGALNVGHLYSFEALPDRKGIKLTQHFEEYPSWLYRIERVVPRSYIVPRIRIETNPIKTLSLLASEEFDPLKEVILETALPVSETKGFEAHLDIVQYTSTDVVIRASLNSSGILVLADSYYPGWTVYVNGKDEIIRRANLFFRAVALPAGHHTVEFRYAPMSFRVGLIVSVATIVGLCLVPVSIGFRRRKQKDPNSGS